MLYHDKLEAAYKLAVIMGLYRLANRIRSIKIEPSPMGTAHTNGFDIVIDPSFIDTLSNGDVLFIAAHEYYHIVYDHVRRGQGKNALVWNVAGDLIINSHLVDVLGIPKPSKHEGATMGVWRNNPIFDGMPDDCNTTSKVYNWLMNKEDELPQDMAMGDLVEDGAEPDELELRQEQQKEAKEYGEYGEIKESLGITDTTETDWLPLVKAMQIESGRLVRRNIIYNYSRPSRRPEMKGIISPSARHVQAMPKVDVYIDISGSMNEAPRQIFEGLKSILAHTIIYRPSFYTFNTEITEIDIKDTAINVGGGTNIKRVIAKVVSDKADLAIIITDCEDSVRREDFPPNAVIVSDNNSFADYYTEDWIKVRKT